MKIENEFYDYYQRKLDEVQTPLPPRFSEPGCSKRRVIKPAMAAAAVLILVFLPLLCRAGTPSKLAVRAASFSEYHELDSRIRNGLLEFQKIASYSSVSGGKK